MFKLVIKINTLAFQNYVKVIECDNNRLNDEINAIRKLFLKSNSSETCNLLRNEIGSFYETFNIFTKEK